MASRGPGAATGAEKEEGMEPAAPPGIVYDPSAC